MTRREYCAKHNIAVTTLDYWRRTQKDRKPKLVELAIEPATARAQAASATKIYVALEGVDMREGFEGLYGWCGISSGQIR